MDLEDDLEQAVDRAEEIDEVVCKARSYVLKTKKPREEKKKKKDEQPTPRYFGLLPEVDLIGVIGKQMEETSFWNALVAEHRTTVRPHITVVHKNSLPGATELWERCSQLHRMAFPPSFTFTLGHLVWNK
ncbi:uncharacterized protein EDB91DRAFT_1351111 [Suillus paluster]|uniref:uncharacterized protein n=1 Tax=Suillus paluster TaxID=48578 RepID=UPI001B87B5A8|nr:uncharacterized protein EDB91DRAFT_1351111 [Suillus paluster]KAG1723779.1 hypothetical protein EDB91DRAFT_1351111 [Suillus paluster]